MRTSNAEFTVAEYVRQMQKGDITVNKNYQRTNAVWPPAARSYLIDTIISGYPIPKLSLHQKTDLRTRTTTKEIVDGQQRSQAIRDFYEDKLRLATPSQYKGKTYSQLEPQSQEQFISYSLSTDILAAATEDEIREVFRRINSYNVPLNPAEKRHAKFQGAFKWFIVKRCEDHSQNLRDLDVYSEQQLARMHDAALFTEVCRTLLYGIDHASESKLEEVYKQFDNDFPADRVMRSAISDSIRLLVALEGLHRTPIYKHYNVYSFMTAVGHLTRKEPKLQSHFKVVRQVRIEAKKVITSLSRLARALESDDKEGPLSDFVMACAAKTNRKDTRITRFVWFCRALSGQL